MNAYNFYTVSSSFFVQGCDFPEKIVIMIIGKRLSNNTLEEKLKIFGVKLKVEGN